MDKAQHNERPTDIVQMSTLRQEAKRSVRLIKAMFAIAPYLCNLWNKSYIANRTSLMLVLLVYEISEPQAQFEEPHPFTKLRFEWVPRTLVLRTSDLGQFRIILVRKVIFTSAAFGINFINCLMKMSVREFIQLSAANEYEFARHRIQKLTIYVDQQTRENHFSMCNCQFARLSCVELSFRCAIL